MPRTISDDSLYTLLADVAPAAQPEMTRDVPLSEARVLVVDDNAISQLITMQQLRALACVPHTASSGVAALEATIAAPFELILLDCRMPDIDGYATARAIRSLEVAHCRPRAAIVAITADVDIECVEKCFSSGMDAHLAKPTSVAALRGILRRFLE